MTKENYGELELNYSGILMRHLDRMSGLITNTIMDDHGTFINSNKAKDEALNWSVKFLKALIPSDMRDEEFLKKHKTIWDEYARIQAKHSENGYPSVIFDFRTLHECVDLLNRQGLLLQDQSLLKSIKKNKKVTESEVWEDGQR